jgi:hypothetical protein
MNKIGIGSLWIKFEAQKIENNSSRASNQFRKFGTLRYRIKMSETYRARNGMR